MARILLLFLCLRCSAAVYYVAPTGTAGGDGSIADPWDIYTAFMVKTNVLQAGDTVYLRAGSYTNTTQLLEAKFSGAAGNPITVTSYNNEWAIITKAPSVGQTYRTFDVTGSNIVFSNFEVTNQETNRTTGNFGWGIHNYGSYNAFRNLAIHDTANAIYSPNGTLDTEIYGCWLYNNGLDDGANGHGIYARSTLPTFTIAENLCFNQTGFGIQCYSTSSGLKLIGFWLEGNVCAGNGRTKPDGTWNAQFGVTGGGLIDETKVYTNFVLTSQSGGQGIIFGSGGTAGDSRKSEGGIEIVGNYFIGDYLWVQCFTNLVFTNNYIEGDAWFIWSFFPEVYSGESTTPAACSWVWDSNWYRRTDIHAVGWADGYFQQSTNRFLYDFQDWTNATAFDVHSSYAAGSPTETEVFVRTNKYIPTRANIIVVNWASNNTATVNLNAFAYTTGTYNLRYAENPLAVCASGQLSSSITVPLTNLVSAAPNGKTAPTALAPFFATFILDVQGTPSATRYTHTHGSGTLGSSTR